MPALALMPMGTGYSAVLLPDAPGGSAGNTGGRMFNNLQELQTFLRSQNVPAHLIPSEDFTDSKTIELGPARR